MRRTKCFPLYEEKRKRAWNVAILDDVEEDGVDDDTSNGHCLKVACKLWPPDGGNFRRR